MARLDSSVLLVMLAFAPSPSLAGVNDDVLAAARSFANGGGYDRTWGGSGSPIELVHQGQQVLPVAEGGTYCCGFTLAVALRAAAERGLLEGKTFDEVKRLQKDWYGVPEDNQETLCARAVERLGIGCAVDPNDALPGDFVQFWRASGTGHSVIFLGWEWTRGVRTGVRYRSSQGKTDGVGDVVERFADSSSDGVGIDRARTYFCRLNAGRRRLTADDLAALGRFAEAEAMLRAAGASSDAPGPEGPSAQLETLRRVRKDFRLSADAALAALRKQIPDATPDDLTRWTRAGALEARTIDGEPRYFSRAVGNLLLLDDAARKRTAPPPQPVSFNLDGHLTQLVYFSETSPSDNEGSVWPVKHNVRYELSIDADHPRLKPGARVEAWLPYPQEYGPQRDVRLVSATPDGVMVAPNGTPQRSAYFRQTVRALPAPLVFAVEFEYVAAGRIAPLAAEAIPYDETSAVYREYTADRPPHLALTPEVRALAATIVGDERNPLLRARRVFERVSADVPWVGEKEYATIPSLSGEGLTLRRGDCGVQSAAFLALCRAAGVPARWQSGWQTQPGRVGMHDWSEVYVEPWGWLPVDASYGVRTKPDDPRVRGFFCGGIDPYRMIVNLDYGRPLVPAKSGLRSEPADFQRGEVEVDGHNLYFDEWRWKIRVKTTPLANGRTTISEASGGGP